MMCFFSTQVTFAMTGFTIDKRVIYHVSERRGSLTSEITFERWLKMMSVLKDQNHYLKTHAVSRKALETLRVSRVTLSYDTYKRYGFWAAVRVWIGFIGSGIKYANSDIWNLKKVMNSIKKYEDTRKRDARS